jgi:hypothetical protein
MLLFAQIIIRMCVRSVKLIPILQHNNSSDTFKSEITSALMHLMMDRISGEGRASNVENTSVQKLVSFKYRTSFGISERIKGINEDTDREGDFVLWSVTEI